MTMAPLDPLDPNPWQDLARQWEQLGTGWMGWWQQATPASLPAMPGAMAPLTTMPMVTVDEAKIADLNARFQPRFQALTQAMFQIPLAGGVLPELVESAAGDRRFKAAAWREQPYFAFLKQAYLLYAEYVSELAALSPLSDHDKRCLEFATRQYLDAIAPSNFAATNPEVLAKAVETEGGSLVQGLRNL